MKKKQDTIYEADDLDNIYDQEYIESEFKSELNEWRKYNVEQSSDYCAGY